MYALLELGMILMSRQHLPGRANLVLSGFELNQSQALGSCLALPHPSGYRCSPRLCRLPCPVI